MTEPGFDGRNILVVEDEYLMAMDLEEAMREAGANVVGPASSVAQALDLLEAGARIDGAILDVNLGGERVYPVADRLLDRKIPMVFTTGYGAHDLPERFARVPRFEKPIDPRRMGEDLRRALHPR